MNSHKCFAIGKNVGGRGGLAPRLPACKAIPADVFEGQWPQSRTCLKPETMRVTYLWSQNRREIPEGTYSHETALSLHELSDIMPSKLHMTRPLRTILDVLETGRVDKTQIGHTIEEALRRGLIRKQQIDSLPHDRLQDSFRELAGQRL